MEKQKYEAGFSHSFPEIRMLLAGLPIAAAVDAVAENFILRIVMCSPPCGKYNPLVVSVKPSNVTFLIGFEFLNVPKFNLAATIAVRGPLIMQLEGITIGEETEYVPGGSFNSPGVKPLQAAATAAARLVYFFASKEITLGLVEVLTVSWPVAAVGLPPAACATAGAQANTAPVISLKTRRGNVAKHCVRRIVFLLVAKLLRSRLPVNESGARGRFPGGHCKGRLTQTKTLPGANAKPGPTKFTGPLGGGSVSDYRVRTKPLARRTLRVLRSTRHASTGCHDWPDSLSLHFGNCC
jgi:hypothetical protein